MFSFGYSNLYRRKKLNDTLTGKLTNQETPLEEILLEPDVIQDLPNEASQSLS